MNAPQRLCQSYRLHVWWQLSKFPLPSYASKVPMHTLSGSQLTVSALQPEPLSAYTNTYDERGWFTGVRSEVTIPKSQAVVYASLSKDLHKVFTPMTVSAGCPQQASGHCRQHVPELLEQHPAGSDQQLQAPLHRVLCW